MTTWSPWLNDALRVDVHDFDLPEPVVPEAAVADHTGGVHGVPLLDSDWPFAEQCARLIASKAYESGSA